MSRQLDRIDSALAEWLARQRVFFVGTAPLSPGGHVNLSPKGGDVFRVLTSHSVAYQDYTGSGAETAAHLRENGRIVLMFCAFDGSPKVARLHGRGHLVLPSDPQFDGLATNFPANPGMRAIVRVDVTRVSTSCGYAVPLFEFRGNRDTLDRWVMSNTPEQLRAYRAAKNAASIDGLPAFDGS